jgi:uncharacterized protein YdaU (DUF1376 family)
LIAVATNGNGKTRFPYMPFYVDDWLSSDTVARLSLVQRAAYLNLLIRQWKAPNGILPNDEEQLARWSELGVNWKRLGRPILAACFTSTASGYINPKLRGLWIAARSKSEQARKAAEKRWED